MNRDYDRGRRRAQDAVGDPRVRAHRRPRRAPRGVRAACRRLLRRRPAAMSTDPDATTERSPDHEAHRPARRHELGVLGRVLPADQRGDARPARRPALGRLPAAVRRLRRGRAAPARRRLGAGRRAARRRGSGARGRRRRAARAVHEHDAQGRRRDHRRDRDPVRAHRRHDRGGRPRRRARRPSGCSRRRTRWSRTSTSAGCATPRPRGARARRAGPPDRPRRDLRRALRRRGRRRLARRSTGGSSPTSPTAAPRASCSAAPRSTCSSGPRTRPCRSSSSSQGTSVITIQFDLNRNIDAAALDVQTALTIAQRRLPIEMTIPPSFRK